ncbi:RNA polymerase II transcription factor B subunit 1 [Neolecta irregularis DAH-3]|uniref:RNA polymerase II transcription factor B subunit 1 n=1 Tax=Neolecta irregularis (strain DAH-3) TaxID=1198029 RepID=A0A1U7LMH6_NEOID|nr:RNA polymerase II transcription factor B subunit 1 [Neolecta irregularis DAH-3]|eukprot:OLL23721.1 RNA polymerase II transcription factor B subunit 1 [Neolecta irregularis DAH-3]
MEIQLSIPVSYKKSNGTLHITQNDLSWNPSTSHSTAIKFPLQTIKNLQATPEKSAKAMLKVFTGPTGSENTAHTFVFTNRQDCTAMKDGLRDAIALKLQAKKKVGMLHSREELLSDRELQQSLLLEYPELAATFQETVVKGGLSVDQFWGTRINVLQAFDFERSQDKGPYNVLSTLRISTKNNNAEIALSREKISDVFNQHPIIKTIYDQVVPNQLQEVEFWSRFFQSKLCKELRGEPFHSNDASDSVLDKWLGAQARDEEARRLMREEQVLRLIDIEGNEANVSMNTGNRPDHTMRPSTIKTLSSLNRLSQNMLRSSMTNDSDDEHDPDVIISKESTDEQQAEKLQEILLGDLKDDNVDARIILSISKQRQFFDSDKSQTAGHDYDPRPLIRQMKMDLLCPHDLQSILQNSEGCKQAFKDINDSIQKSIVMAASQQAGGESSRAVVLCHDATNEFLKQFWNDFLSGDASLAERLAETAKVLRKTRERVEAVAIAAGDLADQVREQLKPTMRAVDRALKEYERALFLASC